ncbi:MAG: glycosyltransferase [Gammaproteobacteria bacterium]|nr:glycosyltransferase [Gammaproteobacteria bacterium]
MKTSKTILFIGHLWPEPCSSAAGYRTLALINALVNDTLVNNKSEQGEYYWQLHFACAADKTEFCADLDSIGDNLGDKPGIISHQIKLNDSTFDNLIIDLKPDFVFYDRFITEEQFAPRIHEHCPDAINILDTQDLHFLRRARQKALKNGQAIDYYSDDCIREIAAILRCDLSLIISRYEMQLLIEQFTISPDILHYCPFMLSTASDSSHPDTLKPFSAREHFVMIGNFLHSPNWDAVLWCYQSLWPKIRQQLPDAQIHIYGAYPSEKVYQLHQPDKGFIIKGRARDAIETLAHYRVNLAPLRFGAGIKGKIADGFIARTPCVTTPIGYEGMGYEGMAYEGVGDANNKPWGGLVSDTIDNEQQLIQYAVDLYSDESLWRQCSEACLPLIKHLFDERQHTELFIKRLHALNNSLSEHRKNNFFGQILRHNLYRSQYFMSKWIEEKNKEK